VTLPPPRTDEIDARPTKRFFVRMLVRDIELVPAIVDLVDNSVDGAKRMAAATQTSSGSGLTASENGYDAKLATALAGHRVTLSLSPEEFVIEDDCGGIERKDALEYAFRFGRPEDVEPVEGEVGQFGVGMKRALFKLGEWFEVQSIAPSGAFAVEVDVPEWLDEPDDWTFPLRSLKPGKKKPGTRITVKQLLPSVATEFGEPGFMQRLRAQIEFRHHAALAAGLRIKLGRTELKSRMIGLLVGEGLKPRVIEKDIDANGDTVHMRLAAGFVRIDDEDADTDDPNNFTGGGLAGWYVICNDRMLLFADKSRLTGWGVEVADYHPQYRRFRGYVYLYGSPAAMPWNTAKTAIDEDSTLWRIVRGEIIEALRDARTIMNRIKSEVQDQPLSERPVSAQLESAETTRLSDLPPNPRIVVPERPPRQPPRTKSITYTVPISEFHEVASSLQTSTAADVGRSTFYYYYRREVGG
jgi:Histidine kinase-, DNA gyrase B-, and HSP90-like ATPase